MGQRRKGWSSIVILLIFTVFGVHAQDFQVIPSTSTAGQTPSSLAAVFTPLYSLERDDIITLDPMPSSMLMPNVQSVAVQVKGVACPITATTNANSSLLMTLRNGCNLPAGNKVILNITSALGRIPANGTGSYTLQYSTFTKVMTSGMCGFDPVNVWVGSSTTTTKVVSIPAGLRCPGICGNGCHTNTDYKNYPDNFTLSVNGTNLTVTRLDQKPTDSPLGWGMNLSVPCVRACAPDADEVDWQCMQHDTTGQYTPVRIYGREVQCLAASGTTVDCKWVPALRTCKTLIGNINAASGLITCGDVGYGQDGHWCQTALRELMAQVEELSVTSSPGNTGTVPSSVTLTFLMDMKLRNRDIFTLTPAPSLMLKANQSSVGILTKQNGCKLTGYTDWNSTLVGRMVGKCMDDEPDALTFKLTSGLGLIPASPIGPTYTLKYSILSEPRTANLTCVPDPVNIVVGTSTTTTKTITIPAGLVCPLYCGLGCRTNADYATATDNYTLTVNGTQLTITRVGQKPTDTPLGWGMNLSVPCSKTCGPSPVEEACNATNPCLNGGTCLFSSCWCPSGYSGRRCGSVAAVGCNDTVPCFHGGTCIDGACMCPVGFFGFRCEAIGIGAQNCNATNPCQNGGTCINGFCWCAANYTGSRCQSRKCIAGTVQVPVGDSNMPSKTVTVNAGLQCPSPCGKSCRTNTDFPTNPDTFNITVNGTNLTATRIDQTTSWDMLLQVPCTQVCPPDILPAYAQCDDYDFPCQNGGTCWDGVCTCTDGWTGALCDTPPTCGRTNPCRNGGTCYDGECTCSVGYTGYLCDKMYCPDIHLRWPRAIVIRSADVPTCSLEDLWSILEAYDCIMLGDCNTLHCRIPVPMEIITYVQTLNCSHTS